MTYYVRLMRKEDIPQVKDIDHEAFANWSLTNYEHELESNLAHYIVACDDTEKLLEPEKNPENSLAKFTAKVKEFLGHNSEKEALTVERVLGFTGFWFMAEEAHIMSIAVREAYRHRGIGELMLLNVLDMAKDLGARFVTLEARVSNTIAQNLYRKCGFIQTGIRCGYYTDNREDAIIMATGSLISVPFQSLIKRLKEDYREKWGIKFPEKTPSL